MGDVPGGLRLRFKNNSLASPSGTSVRRVFHGLWLGLAGTLLLAGCFDHSDPDDVADAFVDAYYLRYDFAAAARWARGPAEARLDKERTLVDVARRSTPLAAAKAPVYYSKPSVREVKEGLYLYTYRLEIHQAGRVTERNALISLARRPEGLFVINFREETVEEAS